MIIKRSLTKAIEDHISKNEITLIVGPRQSGKTTVMRHIQNKLRQSKKNTLFLSLDNEEDQAYFKSQLSLINKVKREFGKDKSYVFIDEIQRKENAGLFLKGIYDRGLPFKMIVSGSGSIELKEKIHESLVGRKQIFELSTLSFEEFVNFKTKYRYENALEDFLDSESGIVSELLEEYMTYGGYPRVVLPDKTSEKTNIINEIYQSYIEKDMSFLLNIRKTDAVKRLIALMSHRVGMPINTSSISNAINVSTQTVNQYLWYLEKTFILKRVPPYFKNPGKEITKSQSYYFADLGLRNYAGNLWNNPLGHASSGLLFQNLCYNSILNRQPIGSAINFWRTKDKAEVDFIITKGIDVFPVEAKYKRFKKPTIERSLRSYITKYKPKKAYVINLSLKTNKSIGDTIVRFIPYYKISTI